MDNNRVLFSCVGTSDPIRGYHDGPFVHILRRYRPKAVVCVLTPEMDEWNKWDDRYRKVFEWMRDRWQYEPEVIYRFLKVDDVSDLDLLDKPLRDEFEFTRIKFPDAEILVNVTSGTSQMQTIASFLCMDTRYCTKAIQVKNHETKAGTASRTNLPSYAIDLELECNEDETKDENRCVEIKLFPLLKEAKRERIRTLLDRRDFMALKYLQDELPPVLSDLVSHLAARSQLDSIAEKLAGKLSAVLPFKLYPIKTVSGESVSRYKAISEYCLLIILLQSRGNLTEMILKLEPLTVNLQESLIMRALPERYPGLEWNSFVIKDSLDTVRLKKYSTDFYNKLDQVLYGGVRDVKVNTYLCNSIIDCLSLKEDYPAALEFFDLYTNGKLKNLRNKMAHQLKAVSEDDIRSNLGFSSKKLIHYMERALAEIFPVCDTTIFSVYDRCIEYILENY